MATNYFSYDYQQTTILTILAFFSSPCLLFDICNLYNSIITNIEENRREREEKKAKRQKLSNIIDYSSYPQPPAVVISGTEEEEVLI